MPVHACLIEIQAPTGTHGLIIESLGEAVDVNYAVWW